MQTRLQGLAVWEILVFVLNALLFALVGLQLSHILDVLTGHSAGTLIWYGVLVTAAVVGTRLIWAPVFLYLPKLLVRRGGRERASFGHPVLVAWSGMRGAVSLAAALALPLKTHTGASFPDRDLLIFLTFAVIFSTLVVQGLSLPVLIRRLGVTGDGAEDREELLARLEATKAALAQLDALAGEEWTRDDSIERMRGLYEYRKRRFAARAGKIEDDGYEDRSLAYQQTVQAVLAAQRAALIRLRNDGVISNEVMHRVVRDFDLEESRLEI